MSISKVWLDIETRSRIDLSKTSVYRYVRCPDFKILMSSYSEDGQKIQTALEPDEILSFDWLRDSSVVKVAHNAAFERICFSTAFGMKPGKYLPPEEWHDTQAIAAEYGWPQKLENLAKALKVSEKDTAGTRLINLFCKPVPSGARKGMWNGPDTHPMEWLDFIAYCEQDVETLIEVDRVLGDKWPNGMERQIFLADQYINDAGIEIDVRLAAKAEEAAGENQVAQKERVTLLSGVDNPNSVQQMGRWLEREGIKAPNLRAETVSRLLEGDLTDLQREVLELRQELALVASKKFTSALYSVLEDNRLRGTLAFFGAHTGRWAGRGTQVQNLPRAAFKDHKDANGKPIIGTGEVDAEMAILDLYEGLGASAEDLKKLVRAMFGNPDVGFTVVDYAAIEARVVAWLAGEQWALDAFALGRDIYVETGDRMGGLDRSQGKIAVLALGYNGGINSLKALGGVQGWHDPKGRLLNGVALEVAQEKGIPLEYRELDDDGYWMLVKQWRRANPRIVKLWQKLGDAFADTGQAGPILRVTESEDTLGRAVHLWLPSGRAITYHGVRWEVYYVKDEKTGKRIRKEGWRYADPKNPFNPNMRIGTYGGRLTENATQAVARDIMGEALVRLRKAGYNPVAHVHDEIIIEGKHDVEEISRIMCQVPSWAKGMPIDGEGFTCRRYKKG